METTSLKCPSCNGQMKLAEAKPGDKIAKCEYCDTVVDLPDTADKQGFDLNSFFNNMDLKNGITTSTSTVTTTTSTVVIKNGVVVNGENNDELMGSINEILKNSGVHIDGLNLNNVNVQHTESQQDPKPENQPPAPQEKKSLFKKLFGK